MLVCVSLSKATLTATCAYDRAHMQLEEHDQQAGKGGQGLRRLEEAVEAPQGILGPRAIPQEIVQAYHTEDNRRQMGQTCSRIHFALIA